MGVGAKLSDDRGARFRRLEDNVSGMGRESSLKFHQMKKALEHGHKKLQCNP